MKHLRSQRRSLRSLGLGALLLCLAGSQASAGPTDPKLAISRVESSSGFVSSWVEIHGVFPSRDLAQLAYPLQILVRDLASGTSYVRYAMDAGTVEGSSAVLSDGLDAADVPVLLAEGTAVADGPVLFMGADRIDFQLPASFSPGPAEVQMFVLDPGEVVPVLSNAVVFVVPGASQ